MRLARMTVKSISGQIVRQYLQNITAGFSLLLLFFFASLFAANAHAEADFLAPEVAFQFSAQRINETR